MQKDKAEQDFAIVNECAEKIRSLAGVYNLRTGLQSRCFRLGISSTPPCLPGAAFRHDLVHKSRTFAASAIADSYHACAGQG